MTKTTVQQRFAAALASVAITFTLFSAVLSNATPPAADSLLASAPSTTVVY